METFVLLEAVLYRFRDLLGSQNFALFCAYLPVRVARTQTGVWGVITCRGPHTVSEIYQASGCETQYWSLIKFLSRGKWDWQAVCGRLIWVILSYLPVRCTLACAQRASRQTGLPQWVYIYDHTHAIKTGKKQFGLHFFRNHRYRKRNTNQSKFHWGHEFAGLGILGLTSVGALLFPVWVQLLTPGAACLPVRCTQTGALAAFESVIVLIPPGLIIFDRGFNNRKYFKALLQQGHHLLCRVRKNAAFYYPALPKKKGKRGKQPTCLC